MTIGHQNKQLKLAQLFMKTTILRKYPIYWLESSFCLYVEIKISIFHTEIEIIFRLIKSCCYLHGEIVRTGGTI